MTAWPADATCAARSAYGTTCVLARGHAGQHDDQLDTDPGWDRAPSPLTWQQYSERARQVYWNRDFPACRAKGPRNAKCLLNPAHDGDHFGNGFDEYGPLGARQWANRTADKDTP